MTGLVLVVACSFASVDLLYGPPRNAPGRL